jgi:type IV pilus assembly protein PilY1
VVFGNGYESAGSTTSGKAALFVVDAMKGEMLTSLEVEGTPGIANGLSTPKLGDFNADGVADYAYAGDLQGNLWRFDLLRDGRDASNPFITSDDGSGAASAFEVSFGGKPLFTAVADNGTTRQPITSAPSLVRHPLGLGFGYLAIFGTGKFFESVDKDGNKTIAQTMYGIWDRETLGQDTGNPNISRSSLQSQSFSTTTASDGTNTVTARVLSDNDVTWRDKDGNIVQKGWRLNLSQSEGEMVVENMSQLGRTLIAQTLVPNDDPCADGTSNWTYVMNPYTGGRLNHDAFTFSPGSGITPVSVIKQPGEGGITLSQSPDKSFEACTGSSCITIYPDPESRGRQTWRKVEIEE